MSSPLKPWNCADCHRSHEVVHTVGRDDLCLGCLKKRATPSQAAEELGDENGELRAENEQQKLVQQQFDNALNLAVQQRDEARERIESLEAEVEQLSTVSHDRENAYKRLSGPPFNLPTGDERGLLSLDGRLSVLCDGLHGTDRELERLKDLYETCHNSKLHADRCVLRQQGDIRAVRMALKLPNDDLSNLEGVKLLQSELTALRAAPSATK